MKKALPPTRSISPLLLLCLVATLTALSGCVSSDDYAKTVAQFDHSSTILAQSFHSLLINANITEENNFIDSQVFEAQPIDLASIQTRDLLSPDEIKLRTSAIKALADYTTALATLAAGKPAAQIQTDADKASASLATLATDAAAALAHPTATSTTPNYSAPISSAVGAIGEVLTLIEKRHSEAEVRESLKANAPHIQALFQLISKESTELYARQKSTLGETGVILFHDYDTARKMQPVNPATLMQLSDRIKQYRKDAALIDDRDPSKAIAAFHKSHDALVDLILSPKEKKKQSLAQLIAAVKGFATEVTPLAQNIYTLGKSV